AGCGALASRPGLMCTRSDTSESKTGATAKPAPFFQNIIRADLASATVKTLVTRFPSAPSGLLHICHAKSICLTLGVAEEVGAHCNLRFEDTDPEKESDEYVAAIKRDVSWLGFSWNGEVKYTSDYFDQLYQ